LSRLRRFFPVSLRVIVLLFPILGGVYATGRGVTLYSQAQNYNHNEYANPPGFAVFSSAELKSLNMSISVIELDLKQGRTDKANMMIEFELASPTADDQVFGIQFPYVLEELVDFDLSNLNVFRREIVREDPPPPNGQTYTGVSVFYLYFKPDPGETRYSFEVFFRWSGIISKTDVATYKLVIPFARDERAVCSTVRDLFPDTEMRYLTRSEGDHISVSVSSWANLKAAYPWPTSVTGLHGYNLVLLTWELGQIGGASTYETPMTLDAVVAYFEIGEDLEQRNRYMYESGIFSGLGVSLIFSGVHEALKALDELKRKTPNKNKVD
jgi:hypothetical protein